MKALLFVTIMSVAGSTAASMKSDPFKYAGDTEYSGFCKAIVEDDLSLLKRNIIQKVGTVSGSRKGVLRKLLSETGMTCNGLDLIQFSMQRESSEVFAYLSAEK